MDFSLDIGELTNAISQYENVIKDLEDQKENINKAIKELTDQGWSGEAKDKFMENHIKKQEFYTNFIEQMKYEKNALESEEKPNAIQLKKRSENFEACIKRSTSGVALTNDDSGIISLQYGGQFPINNNVSECIDYYKQMNSKFVEILSLVNSLTFTTFTITDDVVNLQNSLRNQTASLTEFNDSFNAYCNSVRDMEYNICSVFSKISGITEGISQIRGMQIISENGQVDKDKVMQLMLKNPDSLTNEEKEILAYVEKVLGEEKYAQLKNQVVRENQNLSQFMNLIGMNATSSVTYIIDPKTGKAIDISNIDKDTLNRINYLADELKWFDKYPNSRITDKDSIMFWKLHRRDYFEHELAKKITNITSGKNVNWKKIKNNIALSWDGIAEIIGGYTEAGLGKTFMSAGKKMVYASAFSTVFSNGTILIPQNKLERKTKTALGAIIGGGLLTIGTYLTAEGGSNWIEGVSKLAKLKNPKIPVYNPLKELTYKKAFGDTNGEKYYNLVGLGTAGICITEDFKTLSRYTNLEDKVKLFPRPTNISKAEKLNLPIENITKQTVEETIKNGAKITVVTTTDTAKVADLTTTTPMILYHKVTEHPLLNKLELSRNTFYTGVGFRNTNSTIDSLQPKPDTDKK
ncbi:hypothetical protein HBE96_19140 [Clostridium sp. P21]|uniref:WXG100 family type VII secretion target n=1 Tax=Clostridium muellerianum TaxID=2716538 RepID=A0A7Y0HQG8_9CLOT|nr:hypothetical protein [Clostridium muellerianum]NMM64727.1 hypothetical protein [Clostridium muellerianum]